MAIIDCNLYLFFYRKYQMVTGMKVTAFWPLEDLDSCTNQKLNPSQLLIISQW